ncbi:MAG TPA: PIN domain-containing protein [Thermoanaerobaculia bacterium]|nr:PIN domain-containing protein [Thermoanaerobaculia bacterium]
MDTNVLVYLFDAGEPSKRAVAREIFERQSAGLELFLSTQVLQEFFVNVTRKLSLPLTAEEALDALIDLAEIPTVQVDVPLVVAAARLSQRHQISLWDALILEAAASCGCGKVLTEDLQDGWEVRGVRVENPFRGLA